MAGLILGVRMGSVVAPEYDVVATPTFGSFLDGKKVRVWVGPVLEYQCGLRVACAQIHELKCECAGITHASRSSSVPGVPSYVDSWFGERRAMILMNEFPTAHPRHWTSRSFPLD